MKRTDLKKILVIGSGPIVIGQGCEFDYSGCQAVKVLRKEGYEITDFHVINDNDVLQVEAYSVTIPWLVVRKEVSLSANLAKKGGLK